MKKFISTLLILLLSIAFVACSQESADTQPSGKVTDSETAKSDIDSEPDREIIIADGKSSSLHVVIPTRSSRVPTYAKDKLFYFVKNTSGAELKDGPASDGGFELIIGNTDREESKLLKAEIKKDQYAIKIGGGKVVMVAGSSAFLYEAMEYFIENYLTVAGDKITVNTLSELYIGKGNSSTLRYKLLSLPYRMIVQNKLADNAPNDIIHKVAESPIAQGGCNDGEYFYQAFINKDKASNEENNICYIVKSKPDMNTATNDTVLVSGRLSLNHANDITYNSRTHELIVAHNNPNRTTLSVVDPDTLTVKRTLTIPYLIYSITYSPERDIYMVGLAGGQTMRYLSAEFTEIQGSKIFSPTNDTKDYVTQGICSDEIFVYHTLWNPKGSVENYDVNVIAVYDWYGNFVCLIGTEIELESENISVMDGELYICAANAGSGAYLYKITP